jgi:hypothetical protein
VGTFNLLVVRTGGDSGTLTVNFSAVVGETAMRGQGFASASGALTFAPGLFLFDPRPPFALLA